MPEDLTTFLDEQLPQIDEEVRRIKSSLQQTSLLLRRAFEPVPEAIEAYKNTHFGWHYSWFTKPEDLPRRPDKASISTQAMCCASVRKLLEVNGRRDFLTHESVRELEGHAKAIAEFLPKYFEWFPSANKDQLGKAELWTSSTYGSDDVFTASWLVQVIPSTVSSFSKLIEFLKDPQKTGESKISVDVNRTLFRRAENEAGPHPLPLLKLVRALKRVKDCVDASQLREFLSRAANWF
jgi:hypothetical protein